MPPQTIKNGNDMKRTATQIQWETDGEEVELPDRIEIPDNIDDEGIADYLSDETGFLHNGFNIEITD